MSLPKHVLQEAITLFQNTSECQTYESTAVITLLPNSGIPIVIRFTYCCLKSRKQCFGYFLEQNKFGNQYIIQIKRRDCDRKFKQEQKKRRFNKQDRTMLPSNWQKKLPNKLWLPSGVSCCLFYEHVTSYCPYTISLYYGPVLTQSQLTDVQQRTTSVLWDFREGL